VCMEVVTPEGPARMWFAGEFREVVPPERLVYTEFVSDEHGVPLIEMTPEGHPATTEVRVQLDADGDRTTMTLTHLGIPSDSPGATGWVMALFKLAVLLDSSR
jgi:uncharacterized protein YndB with AHSA1/START domain